MMTDQKQSLPGPVSIGIMCYNEVATLGPFVDEIKLLMADLGVPFDMTIINDGSRDGSKEKADEIARQDPRISVIHHSTNLGLGTVYREAFYAGSNPIVTVFPADGQFPAEIIRDFLGAIRDKDLILGIVPELKEGRTWIMRFLSWGERLLYRVLFGHFPEFQGILMFRRNILDRIPLTSRGRGWTIQMELIIRALQSHCRIANMPTLMRSRTSGKSKATTFGNTVSNLAQVLQLRWHLWKSNEVSSTNCR